jgi:hypothetical protein
MKVQQNDAAPYGSGSASLMDVISTEKSLCCKILTLKILSPNYDIGTVPRVMFMHFLCVEILLT